jgi:hypothetical protein
MIVLVVAAAILTALAVDELALKPRRARSGIFRLITDPKTTDHRCPRCDRPTDSRVYPWLSDGGAAFRDCWHCMVTFELTP